MPRKITKRSVKQIALVKERLDKMTPEFSKIPLPGIVIIFVSIFIVITGASLLFFEIDNPSPDQSMIVMSSAAIVAGLGLLGFAFGRWARL